MSNSYTGIKIEYRNSSPPDFPLHSKSDGDSLRRFVETTSPGSFTLAEGMGNDRTTFFYFSLITMTSLGYGDVTPATDIARAISVYLVVFGQLYLAIQVAILVGKFIKGSDITEKDRQKEIEDLKKEIRSLKKGRKKD